MRNILALAEKEPVPRLIEWSDLKGSLHNHSTWSDGRQTPEQICSEMDLTETQFRLIKSRAKARYGELGQRRFAIRSPFKKR